MPAPASTLGQTTTRRIFRWGTSDALCRISRGSWHTSLWWEHCAILPPAWHGKSRHGGFFYLGWYRSNHWVVLLQVLYCSEGSRLALTFMSCRQCTALSNCNRDDQHKAEKSSTRRVRHEVFSLRGMLRSWIAGEKVSHYNSSCHIPLAIENCEEMSRRLSIDHRIYWNNILSDRSNMTKVL